MSSPALHVVNNADQLNHDPSAGQVEATAVDWDLVAVLRQQVSKREAEGRPASAAADVSVREERARSIIGEVLEEAARTRLSQAGLVWSEGEQAGLAKAIFDSIYRLGRIQPLVDRPDVEDIIISGAGQVLLRLADGTQTSASAVVDSDEELILLLQEWASRAMPARVFSEANPALHLDLKGARLAATAFVTDRPTVVIRRHRLVDVRLADLVALGTLSGLCGSFLAAAVRSGFSVVISGEQGSGKTTLLRALCAEIPAWERIGTFETEYELMLHEMESFAGRVVAWQSRPGSGERGPDGRPVNEYGMAAQMWDSFRMTLNRAIVGEVRGPEVWPMIKAMESGSGSLSTTHARSAEETLEKLISCALEAGPQVSRAAAVTKLARSVHVVVHTRQIQPDGQAAKRRIVDQVLAVQPGEDVLGYALEPIFASACDEPATARILPDTFDGLWRHGFDQHGFIAEARQTGGLT